MSEVGPEPGDARSNQDLTQAAAAGLRWVAYARIVVEVVLFGSLVWLAHLIPPSAFGLFAIIVIVQELSLRLPFEGIGGALVQRKGVEHRHFQAGLALNIVVALVLMAVTAAIAYLAVRPALGHEAMMLMFAVLPSYLLGAFYAISTATLRRALDFRRLSMLDLVLNTVRSMLSLVLALIGLNASALVFGSVGGFAVAVALGLLFAPVPMPRWNGAAIRDLLPYGAPGRPRDLRLDRLPQRRLRGDRRRPRRRARRASTGAPTSSRSNIRARSATRWRRSPSRCSPARPG